MLALQLIRDHPDTVRDALRRRREETGILDEAIRLDEEHRRNVTEAEALRARRNAVSRDLSRMKEKPPELIAEMRQVREQIDGLEGQGQAIEAELRKLLLQLPNVPLPEVPDGEDESGNVMTRTWGEPRSYTFTPKPHWELGEALGIIDFERGAKLAGARFYVLKGAGARLQRALVQWMLDTHTQKHGYTEIASPYLVKGEVMEGSGQLPKFFDNLYRDAEEDLFLVPTAEVPLTNLYRDEILPPGAVPMNLVAHTPCFRREKASAGRDVRGIKRVHQFDKVELYKFVEPERSVAALEELLEDALSLCRALEIPHRVVQICTGDLGFASAKTYDIEMWAPGCQEWLEVSSCSTCEDFQARRANIRFRREPGGRPEFPHTLNGSGLALPRVMIAVLETYQCEDGSVIVPPALQPYMRGQETIR